MITNKESLIDSASTDNFNKQKDIFTSDFYTMACLKDSKGEIKIDTETTTLSKETVIFYPPNQLIDKQEAKFNDAVFIFFKRDFFDQFFNDSFFIYRFDFFHNTNKPSYVNLSQEKFNPVLELFKEINENIQAFKPDDEHYVRSLLYHILAKLHRYYVEQHNTYGPCDQSLKFIQFKAMVEENIKTKNSVQKYADELRISRSYLNKLSKKFSGQTAKEIIRARMLLVAKKEILYSKKDISEIAYELNFSESSNFFRFFKKLTGLSPQQYRKEYSK